MNMRDCLTESVHILRVVTKSMVTKLTEFAIANNILKEIHIIFVLDVLDFTNQKNSL